MIDIDPIEEADKTRIGDAAEATIAEADKQRMQTIRREGELKRIAGDLPEDAPSLWLFAEHSLTQSAISMIDAGRAFIKLKETLPHGEFQAGLKGRGISLQSARQIMASARRFADRSEKFFKLGRTKLYACLEFSNDDLDALEEGESILDMDLDKMDRMTVRELKAAIARRDADLQIKDQMLEATNKVMSDKDARFNEMEKELHLRSGRTLPWQEQVAPMKDEMNMVSNVLDEALGRMLVLHQSILALDLDDDVRDIARRSMVTRYKEVLDRAAVLVAECQGQFDLELGGYIGAMTDFIMQVPGDEDQDAALQMVTGE